MHSRSRVRGFTTRDMGFVRKGISTAGVIWEAELTRLALSTSGNSAVNIAALAAMGLTLFRASTGTVRTSTTSVITGLAVDVPRVGDFGFGANEMIIEPAATNLHVRSQQIDLWSTTNGSVTANTTVAPDGTTSADFIDATISVNGVWDVNELATGVSVTKTTSAWYNYRDTHLSSVLKAESATDGTQILTCTRAENLVWYKTSGTATVAAANLFPWFKRVPASGGTPQVDLWGVQVEATAFPTEYIPTSGATVTRANEFLRSPAALTVCNGRIGLEYKFRARAAPAESGTARAIWISRTAPFDMVAITAFGGLYTYINSVVGWISAVTMNWVRDDIVEIWIEAGGGNLRTNACYRVNGGTAVNLGGSAIVQPRISAPTTCDHFSCEGSNAFPMSPIRVRAYEPGSRPLWVV